MNRLVNKTPRVSLLALSLLVSSAFTATAHANIEGAAGIEEAQPLPAAVQAAPLNLQVNAQGIRLQAESRTLAQVLGAVSERSGINLRWSEDEAQRPVNADLSAADWESLLDALLRGYNRVDTHSEEGQLLSVYLLSRGEDSLQPLNVSTMPTSTAEAEAHTAPLFVSAEYGMVPEDLQQLPRAALTPVALDVEALHALEPGDQVDLLLSAKHFPVVFDESIDHEDGTLTWIGHLAGYGDDYRVIMTSGEDGSFGRIITPAGPYMLESYNGSSWLIDINATSLASVGFQDDAMYPADHAGEAHDTHAGNLIEGAANTLVGGATSLVGGAFNGATDLLHMTGNWLGAQVTQVHDAAAGVVAAATNRSGAKASANKKRTAKNKRRDRRTKIDLLVLYTDGVNGGRTRLRNLVAISNRAFRDSGVAVRLRVVGFRKVDYTNLSRNADALNALTNAQGMFANVERMRSRTGADLVTLVRPFKYTAQQNCGLAWVNGAGGGSFRRQNGFSVVSDGRDAGYYCSDYSLVHEIGHNMGSVHDRANASFQGAYPHSYGHGSSGRFGTIMSYTSPEVGKFSTPKRRCAGSPCGIASGANSADNVRSLNQVRRNVAAFTSRRTR